MATKPIVPHCATVEAKVSTVLAGVRRASRTGYGSETDRHRFRERLRPSEPVRVTPQSRGQLRCAERDRSHGGVSGLVNL